MNIEKVARGFPVGLLWVVDCFARSGGLEWDRGDQFPQGDFGSFSDASLRIRSYHFCGWLEDDSSLIFGAEMRCFSATEKSK